MARKGGVKERLLQIHDLGDHTGQGPPGNKKEQGGGGMTDPHRWRGDGARMQLEN